jgi:hypothetical protein
VSVRRAALLLAIFLIVRPDAPRAASAWAAGLGAAQVWTDNVFGTESSPGDGITDGRGWLVWAPANSLELGATGRLVRFRDNPALDHGYFQASAEARRSAPGAGTQWSAGLAGAGRTNDELYALYDYRDASAYLGAKHYLTPSFTAQLRADASVRSYPDAPSEDARRIWLSARLHRSLPSRTSFGLGIRTGWKRYDDGRLSDAAAREVSAQAAQSLATRLAVRAWWSHSRLYEHGDASAQLAAFDNPLLDEFSTDGVRAGAALKLFLPWNLLAELSAERAWLDYPGRPPALYDPATDEFLVDDDDLVILAPGERHDAATRVRFDLERRIAETWGGARASLRGSVEWSRQISNDLYWGWEGWSAQVGAAVEF